MCQGGHDLCQKCSRHSAVSLRFSFRTRIARNVIDSITTRYIDSRGRPIVISVIVVFRLVDNLRSLANRR